MPRSTKSVQGISEAVEIGSTRSAAAMTSLSSLLLQTGLPDLPVLLVEPHRILRHGIWRIKFSYDDLQSSSMDAQKATQLAISLHQIGEDDLASEIDEAVERAAYYEQCS